MARSKSGALRRLHIKKIKVIAEAVQNAGGEVEPTNSGRLKITGPDGVTFVDPVVGGEGLAAIYQGIQADTGLHIVLEE